MPQDQHHKLTQESLLAYIKSANAPLSKADLARAFNQNPALDSLIITLIDGAQIDAQLRAIRPERSLPELLFVKITALDEDGELFAQPIDEQLAGNNMMPIWIKGSARATKQLSLGDQAYVRLESKQAHSGHLIGQCLRVIKPETSKPIVAQRRGALLFPLERDLGVKKGFRLAAEELAQLKENDLAIIAKNHQLSRLGPPFAQLIKRLGDDQDLSNIATVSLFKHDIPQEFSQETLAQAEKAQAPELNERQDLRALPFVTIDGQDARDFDDAIFVRQSEQGGFSIIVAIADVTHYVPHGSAMDREALERGNSVYLPNLVVPMLPEALSNGWCSLRPNEDRAVLAVEMIIDQEGRKISHKFLRALIHSHARLTYDQVQDFIDKEQQSLGHEAVDRNITEAYQAFLLLKKQRELRGAVALNIPETQIIIDAQGIQDIGLRQSKEAHRMIEEFMVLANVCAAETLEGKKTLGIYRVHDEPSADKIAALTKLLAGFNIELPRGKTLDPHAINAILERVEQHAESRTIHQAVLMAQSRAVYSADNIGHFGLGLARYAHFTSPIRRYADLSVHRALIKALDLGADGISLEKEVLDNIAEQISTCERRAISAERDTISSFLALYHSKQVGETFDVLVRSVTSFGLFVTIDKTGAEGLLHFDDLPRDYYHTFIDQGYCRAKNSDLIIAQGDILRVKLIQAKPIQGALSFRYIKHVQAGHINENAKTQPLKPSKAQKPVKSAKKSAKAKQDKKASKNTKPAKSATSKAATLQPNKAKQAKVKAVKKKKKKKSNQKSKSL